MQTQCLICRTTFNTFPSYQSRGNGKYCSRKCKNAGQSQWMKKRLPEKHPRWRGGAIYKACAKCNKTIALKKSNIKQHNFCSKSCANSFNTSNRKRKGTFITCFICGRKKYIVPSILKRTGKKQGRFCSQKCRAINNISSQRKTNTNIEQIVEVWLKENNVVYQSQKQVEGIAIVDFFLYPNICLFCDGDYWHSLPKRKKKDYLQRTQLMEKGYKIIVLLGSAILRGERPYEILYYQK